MKVKPAPQHRVVVELKSREDRLLAASVPAAKTLPFTIKEILVPVDFSHCSRKALQYAIPFAESFQATLTLLHVVQINYAFGEYGGVDFPVMEGEMRQTAEQGLQRLVTAEIGSRVPVVLEVRTGQPVPEIAAAAKAGAFDLLIISTHGRTGLKHVLMGSVAENVVRYAPCPVLVVRENEHEFVTA